MSSNGVQPSLVLISSLKKLRMSAVTWLIFCCGLRLRHSMFIIRFFLHLYVRSPKRDTIVVAVISSCRLKQCCGSGTGSLDPGLDSQSWFGSRRAKMTHKVGKRYLNKFLFWSAGYSLLWAEGFLRSVDVLYGGLGISNFSAVFFSCFFFIKTLDPDPQHLSEAAKCFSLFFSVQ
jgi:hypothetical protein